jgi:hypothetical protein
VEQILNEIAVKFFTFAKSDIYNNDDDTVKVMSTSLFDFLNDLWCESNSYVQKNYVEKYLLNA